MGKKILVIHDEADIRTFITAVLKKNGFETVTAENGHLGYEKAVAERPNLVTLDLMMPNQSGTDFFRRLSKNKDICHTPVIVISGLPGRHLAVKQPHAVFDKPINPDDLIDAVHSAIGEADEE